MVWTSPAIVRLSTNDTEINPLGRSITTIEISMLTAVPIFVSLTGSLFLPLLADKIGRKKSLQIMVLGVFLSNIAMAYSTNIPLLTFSSSIMAIFISGVFGVVPIYLTEICEDHNRAKYGCLMAGIIPIGELFAYVIGPFFNLKIFTLLLGVPMILFFVLFFFAPESPVYSLSKKRPEECFSILRKLRSNKTNAEIDIDCYKIRQSLSGSKNGKKTNFFTVFKSKQGRIGIYLTMLLICGQSFCGVPILMALMAPIFNEAGISISGDTIGMVVGVFKVCCFVLTSLVIEKTGRRPMLILSSAGTSVPISALGLFFYLKHIDSPWIPHIQWLPVLSILLYFFFYSFGLGPLPIALMSEFFSTDVRPSAISFISTSTGLVFSVYMFMYPLFAEMVGIHWCMWIFGMCCFGTGLLVYFFLPETKGKSIHEIQEILKNY